MSLTWPPADERYIHISQVHIGQRLPGERVVLGAVELFDTSFSIIGIGKL